MTNLQLTRPIAFIDIETTGLNTQQDRIIEICIIKIHPNAFIEKFKSEYDARTQEQFGEYIFR